MIVARGETYPLERFKRKDNSFEWEDFPDIRFFGRPANNMEKRNYRVQQGVEGNTDGVYVLTSNLPKEIQPKDKIKFMGKIWTIASIGYYFDESRVVNASAFSDDYLISLCPKGLALQ